MKVKTYNAEGKEAGTMELPEKIFGVELNPDLVHQVMVSQQGNRRQVSAHTKGRGEVSGDCSIARPMLFLFLFLESECGRNLL